MGARNTINETIFPASLRKQYVSNIIMHKERRVEHKVKATSGMYIPRRPKARVR